MPSVRRKYSVTVCPILPENVTRNVDDVVTVEHGPLTLNETQTLVAYVPSGFFTVPVKLIACGVAVVVGFGVGVGVRVAGGAVVGRCVGGRWVAVGVAASVGVGGTTLGGAVAGRRQGRGRESDDECRRRDGEHRPADAPREPAAVFAYRPGVLEPRAQLLVGPALHPLGAQRGEEPGETIVVHDRRFLRAAS